jgi:hypothetical protein
MALLLLLQVPPGDGWVNVVVEPKQVVGVPPIGKGVVTTVTTEVVTHPASEYVMVDVPAIAGAVYVPLNGPIVPMPNVHDQNPPVGVAVNVVLAPVHNPSEPTMGPGVTFTVTGFVE